MVAFSQHKTYGLCPAPTTRPAFVPLCPSRSPLRRTEPYPPSNLPSATGALDEVSQMVDAGTPHLTSCIDCCCLVFALALSQPLTTIYLSRPQSQGLATNNLRNTLGLGRASIRAGQQVRQLDAEGLRNGDQLCCSWQVFAPLPYPVSVRGDAQGTRRGRGIGIATCFPSFAQADRKGLFQ